MKPKGVIWKLFTAINRDKARCNTCGKEFSTANRSTTGLSKHAERYHKDELKDAKAADNSESVGNNSLVTLLTLAIATSSVPFNFIENEYFSRFLNRAGVFVSAETIKKTLMEMSQKSCRAVEQQLKGRNRLTVVFDGWSSNNCSFHAFSVFVVYIDSFFEKHTKLIGCKSVDGPSTAEKVAAVIASVLDTAGIGFDNIAYAVSDNGTNLIKLSETLNLTRLPCICHLLSNFFKSVFESKLLAPVMKKARSTAQTLCRSVSIREKFFSFAAIVKPGAKRPKSYSNTRWAGGFLLLRDYIESAEVLLSVPELVQNLPSTEEKTTATSAIELLVDVFSVMTTLESDDSTASAVIPNVLALENHLMSHAQSNSKIGKVIKSEFKKRISEVAKNMDFLVLTLIDPRFAYHRSSVGKTDWDKVEKTFIKIHERNCDTGKQSEPEALPMHTKKNISPLAILMNTEAEDDTTSSSLKEELMKYKSFVTLSKRPDLFSNPLHFWRLNSTNFPLLSTIARELLSVPSSSAATERCFSENTKIFTTRNGDSEDDFSSDSDDESVQKDTQPRGEKRSREDSTEVLEELAKRPNLASTSNEPEILDTQNCGNDDPDYDFED
ncbi:hypothetical protein B9Z55_017582 [Caenorhabditis nigoni]|uniref:BED-type domain-containing protein n=1 Tax=Caenorhabditis nigoni TaxID=1611254 RepID=A0A2G5TA42_9PELO|nr:hypothetical protein B9Z55_017582 [Caenorhabditis nigoni]